MKGTGKGVRFYGACPVGVKPSADLPHAQKNRGPTALGQVRTSVSVEDAAPSRKRTPEATEFAAGTTR